CSGAFSSHGAADDTPPGAARAARLDSPRPAFDCRSWNSERAPRRSAGVAVGPADRGHRPLGVTRPLRGVEAEGGGPGLLDDEAQVRAPGLVDLLHVRLPRLEVVPGVARARRVPVPVVDRDEELRADLLGVALLVDQAV